MTRRMVAFAFALLLLSGCPHRGASQAAYPEISSIVVQGTSHELGRAYSITPRLSEGETTGLYLALYDNGKELRRINLSGNNSPLSVEWHAVPEGKHMLEAALLEGGRQVSTREVAITVLPLGFSGVDDDSQEWWHGPVEFGLMRAQRFGIEAPITARAISVYMKSFVAPPRGSEIAVQLRGDSGGKPGETLAEAPLPSSSLSPEFSWASVRLNQSLELQPGFYWLVLHRSDYDGVVVWAHAKGNPYGSSGDSLFRKGSAGWEQEDADYAFKVSSR